MRGTKHAPANVSVANVRYSDSAPWPRKRALLWEARLQLVIPPGTTGAPANWNSLPQVGLV